MNISSLDKVGMSPNQPIRFDQMKRSDWLLEGIIFIKGWEIYSILKLFKIHDFCENKIAVSWHDHFVCKIHLLY